MTTRVLVVEDNQDIAEAIGEHLRIEGFSVEIAGSGELALARAAAEPPALIILDLMLPGIPGETVLRSLRADGFDTPVLILSAKQEEVDKVHGFRLGADDYVTKPFGLLELLARVHALLRRAVMSPANGRARPTRIMHGRLAFDLGAQTVSCDGHEVALRPKERELLFALLDRAGQTVSRRRLLSEVWGYAPRVDSRTIDWHVAELRRKLHDDASQPNLIVTIRKVGYRLVLDQANS
jgi:DNA-binding response OmpR family regulator